MKQDQALHKARKYHTAVNLNTEAHKHSNQKQEKLTVLVEQFLNLEEHAHRANEGLRNYLGALSADEMINRITELNLSEKAQNILAAGIVLDKNHNDIPVVMAEIIKKHADSPSTDDILDHLNYTAL